MDKYIDWSTDIKEIPLNVIVVVCNINDTTYLQRRSIITVNNELLEHITNFDYVSLIEYNIVKWRAMTTLELIEFNKRGVTDLPSVEIRKYTEPPYHVNDEETKQVSDNDTSDTSLFQEANVIYQSDRMIN